jgi:hypothetical protein
MVEGGGKLGVVHVAASRFQQVVHLGECVHMQVEGQWLEGIRCTTGLQGLADFRRG